MNKNLKKTNSKATSCGNVKSNVVEKLTLELLAERHNALARYIGVPCYIEPDAVTGFPAVPGKQGKKCDGYAGYSATLVPFAGDFDEVVFTAQGNGDDVVCGYVVDKDGKIESVAETPIVEGALVRLPLTPNSHKLYASIPVNDGKPLDDDITIKLFSGGMINQYHHLMTEILSRVAKLEKDFEEHKCSGCDSNA